MKVNNIKEFIKAHRILIIGIVLYIVVFIVRLFFDPLGFIGDEANSETFEEYFVETYLDYDDILPGNKIVQFIPLGFLVEFAFFGIFDLLRMINATSIELNIIMPCIFTWAWLIKEKILSIKTFKPPSKLEKWAIDHLYDQTIMFVLTVIMRLISCLLGNIADFDLSAINLPVRIILIVLSLAGLLAGLVFVIIPAIVNGILSFFWIFALGVAANIAAFFNSMLLGEDEQNASILLHIAAFIIGVAIILGANVMIERLFEIIQSLMSRPVDWIIKKVRKKQKQKKHGSEE